MREFFVLWLCCMYVSTSLGPYIGEAVKNDLIDVNTSSSKEALCSLSNKWEVGSSPVFSCLYEI